MVRRKINVFIEWFFYISKRNSKGFLLIKKCDNLKYMRHTFFQIFVTGIIVLLIAIVINVLATFLGVETWYGFIENIQENGSMVFVKQGWKDIFFLFFLYPFLLGFSAYYSLYRCMRKM